MPLANRMPGPPRHTLGTPEFEAAVAGADASARTQLEAIAETVALATGLGFPVWLRGGWAVDFALGEITRPHAGIDWFCWAADAFTVATALARRGWDLRAGNPHQQIDLVRRETGQSFALLTRDGLGGTVVAGGPHAGAPWPDRMLDGPIGRLAGIDCPAIAPAAQLEIKRMTPNWPPGRPHRSKDLADMARLETLVPARLP